MNSRMSWSCPAIRTAIGKYGGALAACRRAISPRLSYENPWAGPACTQTLATWSSETSSTQRPGTCT